GLIARIASSSRCARFAPGELSLRRELSPACLAALAPPPPRRSGGCGHGARKWIWWREWRRASPFLLPHPPDPALSPGRKHVLRARPSMFLPLRRWMWRMSMQLGMHPPSPSSTRSSWRW
ncbi:hypothetical protein M9458_033491, partial [Cirrhinus mrigala]